MLLTAGFIKWKQRDIHEKRELRKQQLQHYRVEAEMNSTLMSRIEVLMDALRKQGSSDAPSTIVANVMRSFPVDEEKPQNGPSYKEMLENLLKQLDAEVAPIRDHDKASALAHKLSMHRDKLLGIVTKRQAEIRKMEEEDKRKITSEGLREGFNYSSVTKVEPEAPIKESFLKKHPTKQKASSQPAKVQAIETLNPNATPADIAKDKDISAGYEADSDVEIEDAEDLPEHIEPSKIGREFGQIALGDYDASLKFIGKHSSILRDETETDGLLIDAYYAEIKGNSKLAKQYIHQGLLLQYCRQLGRDGVGMFFSRIKDKQHRASKLFLDDVEGTYGRIKQRAAEAIEEDARNAQVGDHGEPVEQIQLHAVDPGTQITIQVPPADHPDQQIQEARAIFEHFSPNLQKALESGDLAEINKVLGMMQVEEAEQVVELLSQGGMLAIEEEILDATKPGFKMPERVKESEQAEAEAQATTVSGPSAIDDVD
jgi:cell division cycle protein 37